MRAILVDDELLPLSWLKKMLLASDIEVVGTYLDPFEAYEMVKVLQPDVVFLDIEMPDLSGLALGEQIQESHPDTEIVFVTGYDRYAVDAFDLYAIDYVMKPVQMGRLQKTIARLENRVGKRQKKVQIRTSLNFFQTMKIVTEDGQVEKMKWRTAKAQELFAYMIYHQGQIIYRDTILELLWPNFDVARAAKQLYTTIYHIRQTLKKYGINMVSITNHSLNVGYRLNKGELRIDTDKWAEEIKRLKPLQFDTLEEYERLFYEYEGDYLIEHDYVWAESERERLRHLFLQHAYRLSEFYLAHGKLGHAMKVTERIQQLYPLEEKSYFNLMKIHNLLSNFMAVEEQYAGLMKIFREQFGTEPSEEVRMWYKKWKMKDKYV